MTGRRRALLLAALLATKALVYAPLGVVAYTGWRTCGQDALAVLEPTAGRLTHFAYTGRRANRFDVAYTYEVGARTYAGHGIVLCPAWASGSGIDDLHLLDRHLAERVGRPVTVWVDPAQPERAVLMRAVPNAALLLIGFVLLTLVIVTVDLDRRWSRRVRARLGER